MIFAAVSQAVPFLTADRTPMGSAITTLMSRAKPASCSVAGRRCHTSPMAEWPGHFQDVPKSPWSALVRKMTYWVVSGLSRPQCLETRS